MFKSAGNEGKNKKKSELRKEKKEKKVENHKKQQQNAKKVVKKSDVFKAPLEVPLVATEATPSLAKDAPNSEAAQVVREQVIASISVKLYECLWLA